MRTNRLEECELTTIERSGLTVVPSDNKKAVYLILDKKEKKAILHCGKHGQIYLKTNEMIEILHEMLDIFAHLGY